MSDRKQYEPRLVMISPEQRAFVQDDANRRYPVLHGPTGKRRNFNPAIRDMLDFVVAHYPFFLTWIASRDNLPTKEQ